MPAKIRFPEGVHSPCKFNSNDDKSLQTFYYKQMKKSKYLLPVMTDFEKNYSIVQQFPPGVRKSLASINYNDNNVIVLALANLDEIHDEKRRNFERRSNFQNQNNAEAINVAQIQAQNGYQGHNRRGRGRFRGYSNYRPYGRQYINTQPSQSQTLPDVRFPPPNITSANNLINPNIPSSSNNNNNNRNLNEISTR